MGRCYETGVQIATVHTRKLTHLRMKTSKLSTVTEWCLEMLRLDMAHQHILGVAVSRAAKAFLL